MSGMRLWQAGLLMLGMALHSSVDAAEVEGIKLDDKVDQVGQALVLNGAGVRSKFFFDIYVGALYLPAKEHQASRVLEHPSPVRVSMSILYKELEAEKLTDGWREGFEKNQNSQQLQVLESRLNAFNAMFGDAHRGDVLLFDFLTDGVTRVVINDVEKGRVQGEDFQRALLAVWLGKKPADGSLKKAMLGR